MSPLYLMNGKVEVTFNFHNLAFLKLVHEICMSFILPSDIALVFHLRLDAANLHVQNL